MRYLREHLKFSFFEASLSFSVFIIVFAITSLIGAKIYELRGVRTAASLGILFTATGTALCSLVEYLRSYIWLVLSYGVITGLGSGLAIHQLSRWRESGFQIEQGWRRG